MIRIATKDLVNILTDLIATTCPDDGAYPELAAVLMFTDRGYAQADEPGKSDVLAGVSTNRRVAGHAFVPVDGQMTPMLWPVSKAVSVIGMFKPKLKGNKEHGVIITRDGEHVIVQEDPNLFDDGDRFDFKSSDLLDKFPRQLTELIENMPTRWIPALFSEQQMKATPRTDFYPADLALLCKIATRRNTLIETYRTDQVARVLVQIGPYWRGWMRPVPYEVGKEKVGQAAYEPSGEVFHPDLPETDVEQPALEEEEEPPPPPVEPTLPLETVDEPDKEAEPVS